MILSLAIFTSGHTDINWHLNWNSTWCTDKPTHSPTCWPAFTYVKEQASARDSVSERHGYYLVLVELGISVAPMGYCLTRADENMDAVITRRRGKKRSIYWRSNIYACIKKKQKNNILFEAGQKAGSHLSHPERELSVSTNHAQGEGPVPAQARAHERRADHHRLERQSTEWGAAPLAHSTNTLYTLTWGWLRWCTSNWLLIFPGQPVVANRFSFALDHLRDEDLRHGWYSIMRRNGGETETGRRRLPEESCFVQMHWPLVLRITGGGGEKTTFMCLSLTSFP